MGRTITITFKLRNQDIEVDAEMLPSEPDVGIMNPYPAGFLITDIEGKTLDWELTPAEEDQLAEALIEAYYDWCED